MKSKNKVLLVIFGIVIFLICDQIRFSAKSQEKVTDSNLSISNLMDSINNVDLPKEEIEDIRSRSKTLTKDIKVSISRIINLD